MSLSEQVTYRFGFFFARLRGLFVLVTLFFVWSAVSMKTGFFAGYSREELMTYVFGAHILRSLVFGSQSRRIASEIHDGTFSLFLVRPVNHFLFYYARELSERLLLGFFAVLEVGIIVVFFDSTFLFPSHLSVFFFVFLSVFLSHMLYYCMSYGMSMLAFWSREAMGPRFLFEWILEFLSGAFFPVSIVATNVALVFLFFALPFIYLVFMPLTIYLERVPGNQLFLSFVWQGMWIAIVAGLLRALWRRGLRAYTGGGI